MKYSFDADMRSVAQRLNAPGSELHGLVMHEIKLSPEDYKHFMSVLENPPAPNENLRRLLQGLPPKYDGPKHVYQKNETSGIGFCEVCHSDDIEDGQHTEGD